MNKFEILGRLNWLKIQYFENGTCMTSIYLSKKKPNANDSDDANNYETFPIIFFNTKKDNVAERITEECIKGDYLRVVGKVGINTYQTQDGRKKNKVELIGWNFKKVRWDSENNKYVDIDSNEGEQSSDEQAA